MNTADQHLLDFLKQAFGLESLSVHQEVTRGVLSQNYILDAGNRHYFLKQWRPENITRIHEVLLVEKHFADHSIPIILPLATLGGESILTHEGAHYSLYPYVEATHIERPDLDGEALDSMASMLAAIHKVSLSGSIPEVKRFNWREPEKALSILRSVQEALDGIADKTQFDLMAAENVSRKMALIEHNALHPIQEALPSNTLLHGDYHESNIFFTRNQVSHVFDLEKAEIAPRVFELIRCIKLTFIDGEYSERNLSRSNRFIRAYSQEFPITAAEVRTGVRLWFYWGIHRSWIEEEHYLKGNTRPDVFLENELKALRYESEHLEELADILTQGLD